MNKGDLVAVWGAGVKSGIYGLGELVGKPIRVPLASTQEKYFIEKEFIDKFREGYSVFVKYSALFVTKPLLLDKFIRDPSLLDMQILMNSQGTNFYLTSSQWERILELLNN